MLHTMTHRFFQTCCWLLMVFGFAACQSPDQPVTQTTQHQTKPTQPDPVVEQDNDVRDYLIERVGDFLVVQLYADGFEELDQKNKLLCYHLSNAAVAGRDIFIDQKFAENLAIRNVLEELYLQRKVLPSGIAKEIERYTKLFWINNGIHGHLTSQKELLLLNQEQFNLAVSLVRRRGAQLPKPKELNRLYRILTDPAIYVSCTEKTPANGSDPLAASSNNLYVGVSTPDLDYFLEEYPLNSRLMKTDEGLEEQVYRAGYKEYIPAGLYAKELGNVIKHLELALPLAEEPTQEALTNLIRYYRTGDPADWRQYNIAWVADNASVVDTINGFVEVYLDARATKGAWEAVVSFLNPVKAKEIQMLADEAQWFEDRMPWSPEFRKDDVKGISSRAITVIMETGDSGPTTPIGINLPNEQDIRQWFGSKSVNLSNVVEAYNAVRGAGARCAGSADEFFLTKEEAQRAARWSTKAADVHVNLHEVVGHASGKTLSVVKNPAQLLGTYYSTIEEARADLIGLYWIADPKLKEMGLVPDQEMALAQYERFSRGVLLQLRRVPLGGRIQDDHMRNRQLIVHWLIENTDAVKVQQSDGKTYYTVTSVESFRQGCGTLLAMVMAIKGTGDFKGAKALVDRYGIQVDADLHQEILARMEELNQAKGTGFVQPELTLVKDESGQVVDVKVYYPRDLAEQMLRFSGRYPPLK